MDAQDSSNMSSICKREFSPDHSGSFIAPLQTCTSTAATKFVPPTTPTEESLRYARHISCYGVLVFGKGRCNCYGMTKTHTKLVKTVDDLSQDYRNVPEGNDERGRMDEGNAEKKKRFNEDNQATSFSTSSKSGLKSSPPFRGVESAIIIGHSFFPLLLDSIPGMNKALTAPYCELGMELTKYDDDEGDERKDINKSRSDPRMANNGINNIKNEISSSCQIDSHRRATEYCRTNGSTMHSNYPSKAEPQSDDGSGSGATPAGAPRTSSNNFNGFPISDKMWREGRGTEATETLTSNSTVMTPNIKEESKKEGAVEDSNRWFTSLLPPPVTTLMKSLSVEAFAKQSEKNVEAMGSWIKELRVAVMGESNSRESR